MREARQEFVEALQTPVSWRQNAGAPWPGVAGTLNNLGILDSGQGRIREARQEFVEALRTIP